MTERNGEFAFIRNLGRMFEIVKLQLDVVSKKVMGMVTSATGTSVFRRQQPLCSSIAKAEQRVKWL